MIQPASSRVVRASFSERQNRRTLPLIDYEAGGEAVNVVAGDRYAFMWEAVCDGTSVTVERTDLREGPILVLDGLSGVTQIAIAFDQAMRVHVAYVDAAGAHFYYWNTLESRMETMQLPEAVTPRLCTDQKHAMFLGTDDVVLAYLRSGVLYCRYQRDRYTIEHVLEQAPDAVALITIGMNDANRLQWKLKPRPGYRPPQP